MRNKNNPRKEYSFHHRKPRSLGGSNDKGNVSRVPNNKHEYWHGLFSNLNPEQIAQVINDFWLDPDFFMVAVPRRNDA